MHRINFFYIINFSIVIINDISDRAMIDKEEDGGKEKPPIYFRELYADVSYHMGSNSAIFIYFYFSVTVVSVKWCRCLLQVRYIVKFWVTFFFRVCIIALLYAVFGIYCEILMIRVVYLMIMMK